jgi:hypothetical protein
MRKLPCLILAGLALSVGMIGSPDPVHATVDAPGRPTWRCRFRLIAIDPPGYRWECRRVGR